MFIFIFGTTIIAAAIYAALSLSKEAKQAKEDAKKAEEEAEEYCKRVETKLDNANDKLDVLLCGPMDKETLEELRAGRESAKNEKPQEPT